MARREDTVSAADLKRLFVNTLLSAKQFMGVLDYVPHPMQHRFHCSKAKGKMFMGGNRGGKTVGGAAETAMRLTGEHPYRDDLPRPPVKGRGVAVDNDRGLKLIMLPELRRWIPQKYLINGKWEDSYSKTDKILTLNNGSTMEFMTYEQDVDKFQGTSRDFVWFDEEPPEEIFKECMARLIDRDGDWWITMTPLIEMSWTYNTLYEPATTGLIPYIEVFEVDTFDNPHINKEAFERLTLTMSEEEKKTRRSGVYISHTGLVYGESFSRDRNVIPDIVRSSRFVILKNEWSHFQTMDFGYNGFTAILFCAYNTDGMVIVYDEIYKNKTLIADLATEWKSRRISLGIETQYVVGDPAIRSTSPIKGTSVQSEFGEQGIYIGLGNNDVNPGIMLCQRMFKEQQLIISSRCHNLLAELNKYRWDRHLTKARDRKNQKEVPIKKDDHACDALRYGMMSRPVRFEEVKDPALLLGVSTSSNIDWELTERDNQYIDAFLGSEI
jgi:phage terminase large subunit-like protein